MKHNKGVTLIELMVVIAIIGILTAIVVPSYQTYILNAGRTDAYDALEKMAKEQERYNLANSIYATNAQIASVGGSSTERGYYTLAIANPSGVVTSYTITATAVATEPQNNDTGCTVLTINQALQKTPTACW